MGNSERNEIDGHLKVDSLSEPFSDISVETDIRQLHRRNIYLPCVLSEDIFLPSQTLSKKITL